MQAAFPGPVHFPVACVWVSGGLPRAQLVKRHIDVNSSKCDYEVGAVVQNGT